MNRTFTLLLFVTIPLAYACTSHQAGHLPHGTQIREAGPGAAGFNYEQLGLLDSLFYAYVVNQAIPSAEVIVVRNGGIAYHKSFSPEGVTRGKDSLFRIMSMTKAITSVAVMQLYEQGKFLLDDPLENYLTEFRDMQVLQSVNPADTTYTSFPAKRKITIRDLLRHTSGLAYGFSSRDLQMIYQKAGVVEAMAIGTEVRTLADNMQVLGSLPLLHEPGTRYTYGVSTDVLGYLVEVVSGQRFDEYLKEQIFMPLGMNDSYFFVPEEKAMLLAKGFSNTDDQPLVRMENSPLVDYHTMTDELFFSGGAGLCMTARDYAVFLQMLLNGGTYGDHRIIGKKTIDLMVTNQLADIPRQSSGQGEREFAFGLGFELGTHDSYRSKPGSLQRFSWGGMLGTTYWWDSENNLAVVGMIQMLPFFHNEMWEKMEVIIYGALDQ